MINSNINIFPLPFRRVNNGTSKGKTMYVHHSVLNDQEGVFNGAA